MGERGKEICFQIWYIWGENNTSLEVIWFAIDFPFFPSTYPSYTVNLPLVCYPFLIIWFFAHILCYSWDVLFSLPHLFRLNSVISLKQFKIYLFYSSTTCSIILLLLWDLSTFTPICISSPMHIFSNSLEIPWG